MNPGREAPAREERRRGKSVREGRAPSPLSPLIQQSVSTGKTAYPGLQSKERQPGLNPDTSDSSANLLPLRSLKKTLSGKIKQNTNTCLSGMNFDGTTRHGFPHGFIPHSPNSGCLLAQDRPLPSHPGWLQCLIPCLYLLSTGLQANSTSLSFLIFK